MYFPPQDINSQLREKFRNAIACIFIYLIAETKRKIATQTQNSESKLRDVNSELSGKKSQNCEM